MTWPMLNSGAKYQVEKSNDVIIVRYKGFFEYEDAVEYKGLMISTVLSLAGKPFSLFMDALVYEGASAEALEVDNEVNQFYNDNNLQYKAVVFTRHQLIDMTLMLEPAMAEQKERLQFFQTEREAREWLASKGFNF